MAEMREVKLPSGAVLKLHAAPFTDAKALYQALLAEVKELKLDAKSEMDVNFFKDIFCAGYASKSVEAAVWKCMEKSLYNGARITFDTFEPVEARQDYLAVLYEVATENVQPFTKSLYAAFVGLSSKISGLQA